MTTEDPKRKAMELLGATCSLCGRVSADLRSIRRTLGTDLPGKFCQSCLPKRRSRHRRRDERPFSHWRDDGS